VGVKEALVFEAAVYYVSVGQGMQEVLSPVASVG